MHSFSIVLLPQDTIDIYERVKNLLAPYYMNLEVEPYKMFFTKEYTYEIAQRRGAGTDLDLLDKLLKDSEEGAGIENGLLYWITTYNPQAKWDYWTIGGNYDQRIFNSDAAQLFLEKKYDEEVCNNICQVSLLSEDVIPNIVISPSGEWNHSFDFGWKMMNSVDENKEAEKAWILHLKQLLSRNTHCFAVGLDIHS